MSLFSKKIGAGLTPEQREVLDSYSARHKVSRSEIVRKAIEQILLNSTSRMQEQFRITLETRQQIMARAMEKLKEGREKTLRKKKKERKGNVVSIRKNVA